MSFSFGAIGNRIKIKVLGLANLNMEQDDDVVMYQRDRVTGILWDGMEAEGSYVPGWKLMLRLLLR